MKKAGNLTGLDKNYEPKQSLGGTLTMDNDLEAEHQLLDRRYLAQLDFELEQDKGYTQQWVDLD